jgi:hypothetical protein
VIIIFKKFRFPPFLELFISNSFPSSELIFQRWIGVVISVIIGELTIPVVILLTLRKFTFFSWRGRISGHQSAIRLNCRGTFQRTLDIIGLEEI